MRPDPDDYDDEDAYYDALSDAAERGELRPIPGTELGPEAAQAEARALLMAATGASTIDEAVRIALQRPETA